MKKKLIFLLTLSAAMSSLSFLSCQKKTESLEIAPIHELGVDDRPLPYTNPFWMANIDDSKYLYEFTIPGTHDCAADLYTSQQGTMKDYVIAQDYYISNQILLGVRWFDVRLCLSNGNLLAYHGPYYLHKNFNDLLTAAINFLAAHPTETVIFMIKQEHSSESDDNFARAVDSYLRGRSSDLKLYYTGPVFPTMGMVRGKIVIFSRYMNYTGTAFSGIYINWDDNTKGENIDNVGFPLWVQDHYSLNSVSDAEKCAEIEAGINFAQNAHNNRLYINFTSGERDAQLQPLFEAADAINPVIDSYLQSHPSWNSCGVIFVNFAGGCDYTNHDGTFTACPDLVQHIIDHSNYTHPEVTIGTQTWMKMNLSTSFYANGDPIPNVTNAQQWIQLKTGAYRCYDDNPNTFPWIGKLYNYYALHDPKGICPKGYHVPTDADWEKLISYLGGPQVAGGKLKDTLDDWHHQITWNQPNTGATNSSGFTACGAGYWFYGDYYNMLNMAVFFGLDASHDSASTYALYNTSAAIQHYADTSKGYYGMSVRCIKN